MSERLHLKVKAIKGEQVYRNVIRIPTEHRGGIRQGQICRISTVSGRAFVEVRGKPSVEAKEVFMSSFVRRDLGVDVEAFADFKLRPVGWFGRLRWATKTPDSSLRLAAQLGVISVVLGLLSLTISLATVPWADLIRWLRGMAA